MDWKTVGNWLKANAGTGAALVGSLLTGSVPTAVALGMSLVTSATGEVDPDKALAAMQTDPGTVVKLKELAVREGENIRENLRLTHEADLKDRQAEHEQTQLTIRSGDNADDVVVRRTRPYQSWASLLMAFFYVGYTTFTDHETSEMILASLLALPWAYAGLRQWGKHSEVKAQAQVLTAKASK